MDITILDTTGKEVSTHKVVDNFVSFKSNDTVFFRNIVANNNNKRQVTAKIKDKSEVSGGGKKPWKQKGTGNARQGSTRSPQWRKGGNVFGPSLNKNYENKVNKKERTLAVKSAWAYKLKKQSFIIVNKLNLPKISSKKAGQILANLNLNGKKTLILINGKEPNIVLSFRNLENVHILNVENISVDKIALFSNIVLTSKTFEFIERIF